MVTPTVCGESCVGALRDVPVSSSPPSHSHLVHGRCETPRLRESLCPDDPLPQGGCQVRPRSFSQMDVTDSGGANPRVNTANTAFDRTRRIHDPPPRGSSLRGGESKIARCLTSSNAANSDAMSPGIRIAAKSKVQAELTRHRGAAKSDLDGPPTDVGGSKKGVQGKSYTPIVGINQFSRDTDGSYLFWCLRELAPRSRLSAEAHRAVQQTFYPSTGRPRTARTTPRPRARRNRALVKAALC